jgi:hypothetical protein
MDDSAARYFRDGIIWIFKAGNSRCGRSAGSNCHFDDGAAGANSAAGTQQRRSQTPLARFNAYFRFAARVPSTERLIRERMNFLAQDDILEPIVVVNA